MRKMGCTSGKILRVIKKSWRLTVTKNTFDRLINRLDMADDRIFEFEYISTETSKTEKQRVKKTRQSTTEYPRAVGQLEKV